MIPQMSAEEIEILMKDMNRFDQTFDRGDNPAAIHSSKVASGVSISDGDNLSHLLDAVPQAVRESQSPRYVLIGGYAIEYQLKRYNPEYVGRDHKDLDLLMPDAIPPSFPPLWNLFDMDFFRPSRVRNGFHIDPSKYEAERITISLSGKRQDIYVAPPEFLLAMAPSGSSARREAEYLMSLI